MLFNITIWTYFLLSYWVILEGQTKQNHVSLSLWSFLLNRRRTDRCLVFPFWESKFVRSCELHRITLRPFLWNMWKFPTFNDRTVDNSLCPFECLLQEGHTSMIRALLELGADLHAKDTRGRSGEQWDTENRKSGLIVDMNEAWFKYDIHPRPPGLIQ